MKERHSNPVLVDFLGLCPALAVSNTVYNALGMSLGTAAVLLAASATVSAARRFIPPEVRLPAYTIIIASLVSMVDLLLKAYAPELSRNLGAFVSLIVVNCLILGQVESFSSKNPPLASLREACWTAMGFSLALVLVAVSRELLGSGRLTVFSKALWPEVWTAGGWQFHRGQISSPFRGFFLFTRPAGALLVVGYLAAFFAWLRSRIPAPHRGKIPNKNPSKVSGKQAAVSHG